jgi:hypothetical protein
LLLLQLACLLQLYPLWRTDDVGAYRSPYPWTERVAGAGAGETGVVAGSVQSPFGTPPPRYRMADTTFAARTRIAALDLDPAPGLLHGLSYPLAPDLDGMHTPPFGRLIYLLPELDWPQRLAWLRLLGVTALTLTEDPGLDGLVRRDAVERFGLTTYLLGVEGAAPPVWWPRRLVPVESEVIAFAATASLPDPLAAAVVVRPPGAAPAHDSGGRARLVSESPDRVEIEVESAGGLLVLRRAYRPELIAETGGQRLETEPADFALLGVWVPPGRHRVVVRASAVAEGLAGFASLAALIAALVFGLRRRTQ